MKETKIENFIESKQFLKWLTCKEELNTGPWRTLLLLSTPFFLYFILPGIFFWLIVKGYLWAREGYKET